jgi:hypothetical protein
MQMLRGGVHHPLLLLHVPLRHPLLLLLVGMLSAPVVALDWQQLLQGPFEGCVQWLLTTAAVRRPAAAAAAAAAAGACQLVQMQHQVLLLLLTVERPGPACWGLLLGVSQDLPTQVPAVSYHTPL